MASPKTLVRCANKYVFEIDMETLEPKSCAWYDHCCFIDPDPNYKYIDEPDYTKMSQNENNRND